MATEEAEDAAGSVVPAVHPLCLQLKAQHQRFVHHHVRQRCPPFKWSRAERVSLRSHVNIQPIDPLCLADLQRPQNEDFFSLVPTTDTVSKQADVM